MTHAMPDGVHRLGTALVAAVIASVFLTGERPALAEQPVKDISFAQADGKPLLLDVYPAKGARGTKAPCVIWIHGGGWYSGSKENPPCLALVDHGFAVVSINYRLTDEASFPAQIHDCKAAVRFVRAHAADYAIDPDRIGVLGLSAGGQLAALVGTSGDVPELEGNLGVTDVTSRVQAVAEGYGPADFAVMLAEVSKHPTAAAPGKPTNVDAVQALLKGSTPEETNQLVKAASPVTYVRKGLPPFFIFHGTADKIVPANQSELLHENLRASGNDSTLHLMPGVPHGKQDPEVIRQVIAFFKRTLAEPEPSVPGSDTRQPAGSP